MGWTEKTGIFFLPRPMSGVEAVRYAAELGVGAFEPLCSLTEAEPDADEARQMREEAARLNIALPCLSVGISVVGETAEAAVKRLKGCADAAERLGIPYLHHTVCLTLSPEEAEKPFEQVLEEALPRVRAVYDYAEARGVQCVYEDQGFYFNGAARFGTFLEALNRPAGVVLDIGNIGFAGERAIDFARRFADKIRHVHVKDYRRCPYDPEKKGYRLGADMLSRAMLGEGSMAVQETLNFLKDIGYQGWLMLENETVGEDAYAEQAECVRRLRAMLA